MNAQKVAQTSYSLNFEFNPFCMVGYMLFNIIRFVVFQTEID